MAASQKINSNFYEGQEIFVIVYLGLALTAVVFAVYYLFSSRKSSQPVQTTLIAAHCFLCCFLFWETLEAQLSLFLDLSRILLCTFIILLNAAILQYEAKKTNYLYHKKRALLKAAGFLNLARGILSVAFAWLLGMSNSIFLHYDNLLKTMILAVALIVLSALLLKSQSLKYDDKYNEKNLINVLIIVIWLFDLDNLFRVNNTFYIDEIMSALVNVIVSLSAITLSLMCTFDNFEFGPFDDKRGHFSFWIKKSLTPLCLLSGFVSAAHFFIFRNSNESMTSLENVSIWLTLAFGLILLIFAVVIHFAKKPLSAATKALVLLTAAIIVASGFISFVKEGFFRANLVFCFALIVACVASVITDGKKRKTSGDADKTYRNCDESSQSNI
ncbi:MAG: hypothetical protein ACI4M1_03965 [Christensenellales bacterium]